MLTVADYLHYLRASSEFVNWPPDVFAVVVSLLQKSGAYTRAISDWWPPSDPDNGVPLGTHARLWAQRMKEIGLQWRAGVLTGPHKIPPEVIKWWDVVMNPGELKVKEIRTDDGFCTALLQLCAVADEASEGVGLPPTRDDYDLQGWLTLDDRGTLCLHVDPTVVRVLPKCHTPKVGMTVRSLSHHLSLVPAGDVDTRWYVFEPRRQQDRKGIRSLNLLLVPQPRLVLPDNFRETDGPLQNMDKSSQFGFFTCDLQGRVNLKQIAALFDRAQSIVQSAGAVHSVDGVILPELSLSEEEYQQLRKMIVDDRKALLVAGVGDAARGHQFGKNYVRFDIPVDIDATDEEDRAVVNPQHKHHRWLLDGGQIAQYGLNRSLDANRKWWNVSTFQNDSWRLFRSSRG